MRSSKSSTFDGFLSVKERVSLDAFILLGGGFGLCLESLQIGMCLSAAIGLNLRVQYGHSILSSFFLASMQATGFVSIFGAIYFIFSSSSLGTFLCLGWVLAPIFFIGFSLVQFR